LPNLLSDAARIVEELVPPAWCRARIAELTERGFDATATSYPAWYRDNDRLVFDDARLASDVFDRVRPHLPEQLDVDGERWLLVGLNERFRACRYAGGQSFCIHRDGAHVAADRRSHLTLQIYLDAVPELIGGRTRFYRSRHGGEPIAAIAPRVGTGIVFDHRTWHDGEPVARGIKHVLRTDVMYRRAEPLRARARDDGVIGRHDGYAWCAIAGAAGLATAGRDGCVRRWAADGAATSFQLAAGSVTALVEAPNEDVWCGTRSGAIVRLDPSGRTHAIANELGAVLALTIDRDLVVAATARGELVAHDLAGSQRWVARVHDGWVWGLARTPAGELASCGDDGRIASTDAAARTRTLAVVDAGCRAIAATPGGDLIVGDREGTAHRIAGDGSPRARWRAHDGAVTCALALPDDAIVTGGEDGRVVAWRGDRATELARLDDFVTRLVWWRDRLVATGYDGIVRAL
jgi:hypothetical protein